VNIQIGGGGFSFHYLTDYQFTTASHDDAPPLIKVLKMGAVAPGFFLVSAQKDHWTKVSEFANMANMNYTIEYFHSHVKKDIEGWPVGILADYARLVELLLEFGPNLRMPHSRAMGDGLFELRLRGREGIGRALYCFVVGQRVVILHAFVKKTQETQEKELRLARKRMKEVRNG
jgi:phage-related protein